MLSETAIKEFGESLRGGIVKPGDSNYDESRKIWNAMIDRKPALIVQVTNADDVSSAMIFAVANKLDITVRGAGHNIAGNCICDGGLMIDFSLMKKTRVDVENKIAYVEPGATLKDFDAEVQKHGLATPVGINSTTGIAGLTLGGGFGWLTRKYGFTIDNLLSAEVVTVDGKKLKAGSYGFFTIPTSKTWTLIFNKVADQWGAFEYNDVEDALRIEVTPMQNNCWQEWMAYVINKSSDNKAVITIEWEKLKVPFNVEVEI